MQANQPHLLCVTTSFTSDGSLVALGKIKHTACECGEEGAGELKHQIPILIKLYHAQLHGVDCTSDLERSPFDTCCALPS